MSYWSGILSIHNPHFETDRHLGHPQQEAIDTQSNDVIIAITQYRAIEITGEDACLFLQNQLSSDVKALAIGERQLTSWNSPNGRMLACFPLWRLATGFIAILRNDICIKIAARLRMFVLRSKVTIRVCDEQALIAFNGPASELVCHPSATCLAIDTHRSLALLDPAYLAEAWSNTTRTPVGEHCWDWLTLQAGEMQVELATQDQFIPQMVNLDLTGGISFKKGCYPGQEIVARTYYLGRLKRRMYRAHITNTSADVAQPLYCPELSPQSIGMICMAAPAPEGGMDLLVVIQTTAHNQNVHLGSADGIMLSWRELPYEIPAEAGFHANLANNTTT